MSTVHSFKMAQMLRTISHLEKQDRLLVVGFEIKAKKVQADFYREKMVDSIGVLYQAASNLLYDTLFEIKKLEEEKAKLELALSR